MPPAPASPALISTPSTPTVPWLSSRAQRSEAEGPDSLPNSPHHHAAQTNPGPHPPDIQPRHQAQLLWSATPLPQRLAILRRARHLLATDTSTITAAISPTLPRNPADTLAAELLPLLAAIQFLEREAPAILRPRTLGAHHRPLWLAGLRATVERVPLGTVLVIGPANYPLFLPAVQTLQALAAGNAVLWKPGRDASPIAHLVAQTLAAAGLPPHLLTVLPESPEAAQQAIDHGVDKVLLTGSAVTGRAVLHRAAETLTPVVAELSGADTVIVLPSADLSLVADALAFGLRLNGSSTCMAPRRLVLLDPNPQTRANLLHLLTTRLAAIPPVPLQPDTATRLRDLLAQAESNGTHILHGGWAPNGHLHPTLLADVSPLDPLAQADLFAPVLSLLAVSTEPQLLAAQLACPLALTAAIFGPEPAAHRLARKLTVGTVLINDLIVPTADPRLPFPARRGSGFGSTRGPEGLLELTAPRVIAIQRGRSRRRFQPTSAPHVGLFAGLAALLYAGTVATRWRGLQQLSASARKLS